MKKVDPAPSMLSKAHKRPRVGEAGPLRVSEAREKEAEVVGVEAWGKRACKELA